MKPLLLDLFCKAGGASVGYNRAGFDVIGVDIEPQPNYPFKFVQADAIEILANLVDGQPIKYAQFSRYNLSDFDVFAGSPPCQLYSTIRRGLWKDREHPDLIADTRNLFLACRKPYIIENVHNAKRNLIDPITLCGSMFDLHTESGNQLRRHRCFESLIPVIAPKCNHNKKQVVGVYGHAGGGSKRDGIKFFGVDTWKQVMGIDWMTGDELAQAIPPAYTEYIGKQIIAQL